VDIDLGKPVHFSQVCWLAWRQKIGTGDQHGRQDGNTSDYTGLLPLIDQTLRQQRGNKTKTAQVLGIHRTLLYRKMTLLAMVR
jgi:DNA-binding NtrC family response regulator